MRQLRRGDFVKLSAKALLTACGLLGAGAVLRFLSHPTETPPPSRVDIGPAEDYPPGSTTVLPGIPAILVHNQIGFSALSLVCTHLGCTLAPDEAGFTCPCHNSRYGPDGAVLSGPAQKSLTALRLEQTDENHLIIFLHEGNPNEH